MSILDTILEYKRREEVPARQRAVPLDEVRRLAEQAGPTRDFGAALRRADGKVALIAEVKRASPSKGDLVKGEFRPVEIAQQYEANGASAISVLTDEPYFKGAMQYLTDVHNAVGIPTLRKDFMVDAYQLYEARAAGADAILLIVSALNDAELQSLHTLAHELQLTALVEVHDEGETERALKIGASVIGVNNRNLHTFVTDLQTTARCARVVQEAKQDCTFVSESGIFTTADVQSVAAMGAHAILVGESIITSGDIPAQVTRLANIKL